eukprot:CAMPEP_0204525994 /NCGR_PEP_ID=MMETSP0661-20131031/8202_1 /ASSEMBLY_ACC=CAM_ASM_000606 /TAXON_ID=109239 /ORGANISM="Alexandrium margalefi, Strain AMGDE01CS-322" /LENGTH=287 /DNA_ID=CAMNT_0051531815 /DNA_START=74 /DNA_END=935 /DNA_ORIENTATION=+
MGFASLATARNHPQGCFKNCKAVLVTASMNLQLLHGLGQPGRPTRFQMPNEVLGEADAPVAVLVDGPEERVDLHVAETVLTVQRFDQLRKEVLADPLAIRVKLIEVGPDHLGVRDGHPQGPGHRPRVVLAPRQVRLAEGVHGLHGEDPLEAEEERAPVMDVALQLCFVVGVLDGLQRVDATLEVVAMPGRFRQGLADPPGPLLYHFQRILPGPLDSLAAQVLRQVRQRSRELGLVQALLKDPLHLCTLAVQPSSSALFAATSPSERQGGDGSCTVALPARSHHLLHP